ncbi:MAG: hypothetical protein JXO49_06055 [Deltaproteobacteria bacterium]|nr:hypothetical protein [Candidatus Anaeroferrophillus wilburensis]MBN2888889.1 hypothetical protein [Deltaproteobacteria bacterium]
MRVLLVHAIRLFILVSLVFTVGGCQSGQQWYHPHKRLCDFRLDDAMCQEIALAKARDASLTPQHIAEVYSRVYSNCLSAQGWQPVGTRSEPVVFAAVQLRQTLAGVTFAADRLSMTLAGAYQVLQQSDTSALLLAGQTYLSLIFQLHSPSRFLKILPPLGPDAVLFDRCREKKAASQFYYQEVSGRLIFACTSYLYPGRRDRIIMTFSRDVCAMPEDFMELPREQFDLLLACQREWQVTLAALAEQL